MGITTFISEVLRDGRPFTRRDALARRTKKNKGQNIGRRLDAHVRDVIDRHTRATLIAVPVVSDQSAVQKRLVSVFRCLRRHNVFPVSAQTLVRDTDLGIRSYSDAIGLSLDGDVVVIELKATAVSATHHRQVYHTEASKNPLRNGLPDTEAVHHKLQAGFGALAAKLTFPQLSTFKRVRACVVVSCSDACELYWVPERYFSRRMFDVSRDRQVAVPMARRPPRSAPSKKKTMPKVVMAPWPTSAPGLLRALPSFGYASKVELQEQDAPGVLRPMDGSNAHGVSIVITRPWHTLSTSMQTSITKFVESKAKKIAKKRTGARVMGLVLYPGRHGRWSIIRVSSAVVAANVV